MKHTINLYSHFYPPHKGGIEFYTQNFARELKSREYTVNIITCKSDESEFFSNEDGINIYRLSAISLFNQRFPIPYKINQFYRVYKDCYSGKTLNVMNSRLFLTTLLGLILSSLSRSNKKIIIEHGSGHLVYSNGFFTKLFQWYEHIITLILRLFRPKFYSVSTPSARWLNHFGIVSQGNIYNGVNVIDTKSEEKTNTILYAGRLVREKGVMELIDGFLLFNKDGRYTLKIAGDGELKPQINEIIAKNKNVIYLGLLNKDDLYQTMLNSELFVHPSRYPEGLPSVILEAGILGVPIISTKNGIEDLNRNNLIYTMGNGDSTEIKDALEYFEANKKIFVKNSYDLQKFIKENFEWGKIVDRFIKEFRI